MLNLSSSCVFYISEMNDTKMGKRFDAIEARQAKQEEKNRYYHTRGEVPWSACSVSSSKGKWLMSLSSRPR